MSRRHRAAESPMSFFSFQDIMACTTGIFIIITVLLILELIQRSKIMHSDTRPPVDDVAALQRQIAQAERHAAEIDESIRRSTEAVEKLVSAPVFTEEQLRDLKQRVQNLRDRAEDEQQKANKVADHEKTLRDQVAKAVEKQKALEQELVKARDEADKAQKAREEPTVQLVGEAPTKEVIVVECDGSNYRVGRWDAAAKKVRSDINFSNVSEFLAWTQDKDPGHDSFTFVIRPAGAAEKGYLEELHKRGFDIGWDPLPEGREIFVP